MNPQQKISLGAALASLAGTGIALSSIFGWTSLDSPLGFLIGFVFGIAAGAGVVLAIAGLLEHRRTK
jgi:divalent metal cation (Fe/Co/Zn/Cd) transporter